MKRMLLFLGLTAPGLALHAQTLSTVTGLKLFEHHSSSINGGAPFGSGANGSQSGYDFVNRTHFNSFNPANFGAYLNGEEANIDMVEHNGSFGNGGNFGFTSAVSSIWGGDIKGNGSTRWMKAPASFNYNTVTDVSAIVAAFDAAAATTAIAAVEDNAVYLGRIRNTSLYVAIRCTNVKNAGSPGGVKDVSFDFEYKYATHNPNTTSLETRTVQSLLAIYPNPAQDYITLRNEQQHAVTATIVTPSGRVLRSLSLAQGKQQTVSLDELSSGLYFIVCKSADGYVHTEKLIRK